MRIWSLLSLSRFHYNINCNYINMKFLCLSLLVASASAFAPAVSNTRAATQLYGEYGASSTSFYTTTEKQDSYASLDDILQEKCKDEKVRQVIVDMLDVCADITEALRTALVTVEDTSNEFGDTQLSVDVSELFVANKIAFIQEGNSSCSFSSSTDRTRVSQSSQSFIFLTFFPNFLLSCLSFTICHHKLLS